MAGDLVCQRGADGLSETGRGIHIVIYNENPRGDRLKSGGHNARYARITKTVIIGRYDRRFWHPGPWGTGMKQRFLMWGLASIAFAVTLAISSWREGLWPADETLTNRPTALASADPIPLPTQPFGPAHPAPALATPPVVALTPPQQQAPQQPETLEPASEVAPPMPTAEAEVDTAEFLRHRDRAAQHSARAR